MGAMKELFSRALVKDGFYADVLLGTGDDGDEVTDLDAKPEKMSIDAEGHEHKGKGPGGGQFTSTGQGGAAVAERPSPAYEGGVVDEDGIEHIPYDASLKMIDDVNRKAFESAHKKSVVDLDRPKPPKPKKTRARAKEPKVIDLDKAFGETDVPNDVEIDAMPKPSLRGAAIKPAQLKAWTAEHIKHPEHARNFEKFFKGSRVIDQEGNPLRVYHGGTTGFDAFDKNKGSGAVERLGSWFAGTPELANARSQQFAQSVDDAKLAIRDVWGGERSIPGTDIFDTTEEKFDKGQKFLKEGREYIEKREHIRTIPSYLSMKNPKFFKDRLAVDEFVAENMEIPDEVVEFLRGEIDAGHLDRMLLSVVEDYENEDPSDTVEVVRENNAKSRLAKLLLSAGNPKPEMIQDAVRAVFADYDGLIIENDLGYGPAYVAFNGTQVKSAIANKDDYSLTDPRYEMGMSGRDTMRRRARLIVIDGASYG